MTETFDINKCVRYAYISTEYLDTMRRARDVYVQSRKEGKDKAITVYVKAVTNGLEAYVKATEAQEAK